MSVGLSRLTGPGPVRVGRAFCSAQRSLDARAFDRCEGRPSVFAEAGGDVAVDPPLRPRLAGHGMPVLPARDRAESRREQVHDPTTRVR